VEPTGTEERVVATYQTQTGTASRTDPTAVIGRRLGAYIVDALIVALIPLAIFFATADITLWEEPLTCAQIEGSPAFDAGGRACTDNVNVTLGDDEYNAVTFRTLAPVFAGLFSLAYLIGVQWIVQGLTGATLGKAIFGIRTVDEQGTGPGIGKQLIRGVVWIVDGIGCGVPLVAPIAIVVSKGHRRVGDMAAGTYVVKASDRGRPVLLPQSTSPSSTPSPYAVPPSAGSDPGYPTAPPQQNFPPPQQNFPPPQQNFPPPQQKFPPPQQKFPPPQQDVAPPPPPSQQDFAPPPPPPVGSEPVQSAVPPSSPEADALGYASTGDIPAGDAPAEGPQWDAERNAYVQHDASRGWLIFDDATQEWKPLD
jgi:uncharacterized RDD family membrane protein YckC